jgi:Putative esterase
VIWGNDAVDDWAGGNSESSGEGGGSMETFNRGNGGLGANWSTVAGTGAPQIIANQVDVSAGESGQLHSAYWSAGTFSNDQYAQAKLPNIMAGCCGPGIAVRLADSRGYILWWGNDGSNVTLWRMDSSSSWSFLASSGTLTVAPTDVWRLEAVGNSLKGYQNGNLVVEATDSTYTGGSPGIWLYFNGRPLDDWSGGDVTGYLIKGTVSGLTGTLVVQNNGGDTQTLTQNGAFSFATPLADGATYAVTVLSQPGGQTCTVLNGSGTVSGHDVDTVTLVCTNNPTATVLARSDDFNRADGALGPNWANLPEGGVAIGSGRVVGTRSESSSGSYRIDASYSNDQYSEITVTSLPLSVWVGASVRNQGSGNLYAGIYYAYGGVPQLRLYKRVGGAWTQLGTSYDCGVLAAGTKLRVVVLGTTLAFLQDGVVRIAVSDTDISGGAPGIVIWGNDAVDDWAGGNSGFDARYLSTDETGIESYSMISAWNGYGVHALRVLRPDNPAPGMPHNFLYVLPVESEGGTNFGDGLRTLQALNAHNQYNVTLIEPSFASESWYADHPSNPNYKYESFMCLELQPWVTTNLTSRSSEQHWLLGFSKSGFGGIDLLFKHPDLFTLGAFWDFPAGGFTTFDQFGGSSAINYGTDANFQSNYRVTPAFVQAHKNAFLTKNRVWISGYQSFQQDVEDFDSLLTALSSILLPLQP